MSNLLEQASLVLIPSGYKEDVVYSQIPLDGSGDMTLTRASNGTRINSAGLVEVCPWNAIQYSNTFNNGVWVTGGYGNLPTLTANSIANPVNGLVDAWTASFASAGTQGRLLQLFTGLPVGVPYTYSMYVKAGTKTSLVIYSDTASFGLNAVFNLSNGTITSLNGVTATITAMSNGWYFLTITNNILSSGNGQYGIVTNTSEDGSVYIYGAQLNIGSTAKPYFPTTDRLNVPRLTYQNGGGGCPSLLLEKQSTNLMWPSEDFTNINWAPSNLTITSNDATSPDGTQNADKFTSTSTTIEIQVRFGSFAILSNVGSSYTVSVYAKKGTADFLRIRNLFVEDGGTGGNAWFNLSTGAVGTVQSSQTASMQNMGNGWYRCVLTGVVGTSNNFNLVDIGFTNTDATNYPSTSVNGYIYGAQLEASSYFTSYIPTTSSSATRVADACFKTGISSLIGQSEGTVFVDYFYLNNSTDDITIGIDGNNGKFMWFRKNGVQFYGNSSALLFSATSTQVQGSRYKIAFVYGQSDFRLYVNGSAVANATTGTFTGTFDDFRFFPVGGAPFENSNRFNQITLFSTKLTNAELASLTTI